MLNMETRWNWLTFPAGAAACTEMKLVTTRASGQASCRPCCKCFVFSNHKTFHLIHHIRPARPPNNCKFTGPLEKWKIDLPSEMEHHPIDSLHWSYCLHSILCYHSFYCVHSGMYAYASKHPIHPILSYCSIKLSKWCKQPLRGSGLVKMFFEGRRGAGGLKAICPMPGALSMKGLSLPPFWSVFTCHLFCSLSVP